MKRIKLVSLILAIAVMTACAANVYAITSRPSRIP